MAGYYSSMEELIGKTPLLKTTRIEKKYGLTAELYAKLECFNPAGSAKDRVALQMLESAMAEGRLKEDAVIVEPTSGNTGVGIAALAAARGYKALIVMPDTMSMERRKLIAAYGAELVLTDGAKGMAGAVDKAQELCRTIKGAILAGQFTNPANPLAHYLTTGPEIWEDLDGQVDMLVAAVGTGGTLSGTARFLKEKNPDLHVVAVEPLSSPLLSKGYAGAHKIQGIGANFIPETLDCDIYDEVIAISDEDAFASAREMAVTEGILVGISSGAALAAAKELAKQERHSKKKIVVILPDTGERYLSAL